MFGLCIEKKKVLCVQTAGLALKDALNQVKIGELKKSF
jgi:hypothetical protein